MGIHMSNFPSCIKNTNFHCFGKREYISDGSLQSVREIVIALRSNVQIIVHGWMFRAGVAVNQIAVQEIVYALEKGDSMKVRSMLESGWRLEASQALYTYLTRMEDPLIPISIQSLVLGDENENVPIEVVAIDVLGLMKEELPRNHLQLAAILLNLLDTVIKSSPADELRGNTLPISMLPLFFNIQTQHISEWRRIVTIFVEMIRQTSSQLEVNLEVANTVRLSLERTSQEIVNLLIPEEQEFLENIIVRRYIQPVGDCNNVQVIERMLPQNEEQYQQQQRQQELR